jgi:hypothetical protein
MYLLRLPEKTSRLSSWQLLACPAESCPFRLVACIRRYFTVRQLVASLRSLASCRLGPKRPPIRAEGETVLPSNGDLLQLPF